MVCMLHYTNKILYFPKKTNFSEGFPNSHSIELRAWPFSHCYSTGDTGDKFPTLPAVPVSAATEEGASRRPGCGPFHLLRHQTWALRGRRALTWRDSLCARAWLPRILLPVRRTCASSWLLPWPPGSWHKWSGPQWARPPQMSPLARGSSAGGQCHHACGVGERPLVCKSGGQGRKSSQTLITASETLQPAYELDFQP